MARNEAAHQWERGVEDSPVSSLGSRAPPQSSVFRSYKSISGVNAPFRARAWASWQRPSPGLRRSAHAFAALGRSELNSRLAKCP